MMLQRHLIDVDMHIGEAGVSRDPPYEVEREYRDDISGASLRLQLVNTQSSHVGRELEKWDLFLLSS